MNKFLQAQKGCCALQVVQQMVMQGVSAARDQTGIVRNQRVKKDFIAKYEHLASILQVLRTRWNSLSRQEIQLDLHLERRSQQPVADGLEPGKRQVRIPVSNAEDGEENAGSREVRKLRVSSTAPSLFTKSTFYNTFQNELRGSPQKVKFTDS